MVEKEKLKWIYLLSGFFIALNTFFIAREFYWFTLFPAAALIVLLSLVALDKLVMLIVFLTPLSVNLQESDFGVALSVPTEPLLFGVMVLFILRLFYEGKFDWEISRHPVSIAILLYLLWMIITTVTSSFPVVSIKFVAAKIWFLVSYYFIATQIFRDYKNIRRYLWLYMASFTIVIIYTIYNHSLEGFKEQPAHVAMVPFYNDHTSYGAMLAMFIPVLIAFCLASNFTRTLKLASWLLLILFLAATVLSYTRAAWVSLVAIFIIYFIYLLRIRMWVVLAGAAAVLALFIIYQDKIFMKLEKNKQTSSADLAEHAQSIYNIRNDASNLERINRWQSALRMFREKPLFGWGPGTYQFNYAPYQFSYEKTIISTNIGDRGNAHSEYIGPLAEQGLPGMLCILGVVIASIFTGSRLYHRLPKGEMKSLVLVVMLGLITYYIHGTLNNFLDTDKASATVWGFMAILVAIDVYHSRRSENTATE
ncbi:MAG: O-antigen ligase family protein [Bacteroidota bacterium]